MKDYLQLGIDKGLISFNEDKSRIRYNWQKKERNYNNPEEKVQVLAFLQLILDYNYPESRIRQFEPVTMGSEIKEADIVVFDDELCVKPLILVECKKQEVSEAEFQQAINQAYSYAFALPSSYCFIKTSCNGTNAIAAFLPSFHVLGSIQTLSISSRIAGVNPIKL